MRRPANRNRTATSVRVEFVALVMTAAVSLSVFITGLSVESPSPYVSFDRAEVDASVIPPEISGGPWTLAAVKGLDLNYTVPASDWVGANCTLVAGSLSVPSIGKTVDGFNSNVSAGTLPVWFFGYLGGAVNHAFTRELLVIVVRGEASFVGEIALTQWCSFYSYDPTSIGRAVVDSDVVAREFGSLPPTQAFLRTVSDSTLLYALLVGPSSTMWEALLTNCISSPGNSTGSASWVIGLYWADGGTFAADYSGTATTCSGVLSYPPYWT